MTPACSTTCDVSRANSSRTLQKSYSTLLQTVHSLGVFAGFCYTQFADTYQEANGLLFADRTPKVPLEQIAAATSGNAATLERTDGIGQILEHANPDE